MKSVEITISRGRTTNQHGIPIKMCCASCSKRKVNNDEGRYCERNGTAVTGSQYCRKWVLSPLLQNAGKGGGQIKGIGYLNYYRERRIKQHNNLKAGRITANELLSAADIRREYEREHGSIYLNF